MLIPSATVLSTNDDNLRGIILSSLTALMKSSKTNSVTPLTFLFRERLKDKSARRDLNRALFAMCNAIAAKKKGGSKSNLVKAGIYDSAVVQQVKAFQPSSYGEVVVFLEQIDFSGLEDERDAAFLLGVQLQQIVEDQLRALASNSTVSR